jgi:hypothetical protein
MAVICFVRAPQAPQATGAGGSHDESPLDNILPPPTKSVWEFGRVEVLDLLKLVSPGSTQSYPERLIY